MSMIKNRLESEFELFGEDFDRMCEFYAEGYHINPEIMIYKIKQMEEVDKNDEAVQEFYADVYTIAKRHTQMDSKEFFELYCEYKNINKLDNGILFNAFKKDMEILAENTKDVLIDIYIGDKKDIRKEYLRTNPRRFLRNKSLIEQVCTVLYMYDEYKEGIDGKGSLGLYNIAINSYENKNYGIYFYDDLFRDKYMEYSEYVDDAIDRYAKMSNLDWLEFTKEFEEYMRREIA